MFIILAIIAAIFVTTGCAEITGGGTSEVNSAQTEQTKESKYGSDYTDQYNEILDKFNDMGIIPIDTFEYLRDGETEEEQSNYYVCVTTKDSETYYGAVVDGEVFVWRSGEPMTAKTKEAEGNVVIQVVNDGQYDGDIDLKIMDSKWEEAASVTLTKENEYKTTLALENGEYTVFGSVKDQPASDTFYIVSGETFEASEEPQIVALYVTEESF